MNKKDYNEMMKLLKKSIEAKQMLKKDFTKIVAILANYCGKTVYETKYLEKDKIFIGIGEKNIFQLPKIIE